mmetsp:Transcript_23192/g.30288  ORF Transcript_23192/g.30288 Transcript_23192/m.30288 type:complete len:110 (+) Transcript_23192:680-1009(+)
MNSWHVKLRTKCLKRNPKQLKVKTSWYKLQLHHQGQSQRNAVNFKEIDPAKWQPKNIFLLCGVDEKICVSHIITPTIYSSFMIEWVVLLFFVRNFVFDSAILSNKDKRN